MVPFMNNVTDEELASLQIRYIYHEAVDVLMKRDLHA